MTRGNSNHGPSWFICEERDRQPDVHAVWHATGCVGCTDRLRLLIGAGVKSSQIAWLADRVDH